MLNHRAVLSALRARLLTVEVATTGATTLTGTETGFSRAAGSFVDDGFTVGMEVTPAGFGDNTPAVINAIADLTIDVLGGRVAAEAEQPNRSLTVGIPEMRAWENRTLAPVDNRWYIEEDYLFGPSRALSTPPEGGVLEHLPTYVLRLNGLAGMSVSALYQVSMDILKTFPPGLDLPLPDGTFVRVRSDPAPYAGQVLPGEAGRAEIVLTFPLWAHSRNSN